MMRSSEWRALKGAVADLHALLTSAPSLAREERGRELMHKLSALDIACLALRVVAPEFLDAHQLSRRDFRDAVESAFPELGYYNFVRPVAPSADDGVVVVKDAIEDLEEILGDLDFALQHEAIEGWERAAWEIQDAYNIHLGSHLADLRSYLYRQCFIGY